MSFEELDHTADYLFRCRGRSPEELFSESARAMFSIMFENNDATGDACVTKEIEVESDSLSNLLIDFLSELLFVAEVDCLVLSGVKPKITGNTLKAEVTGEPFVLEKHGGGTEIKGISRSGVEIEEISEDDGIYYQAEIIFDV
ncbi:archease [Methanomicrobium mobile]|uniref:archease n=1 Tax=Methanomicrobium mobile TaxID=2205 RepID=UPI0005B2A2DF|nr:archease [Methanomicrobium mobile]